MFILNCVHNIRTFTLLVLPLLCMFPKPYIAIGTVPNIAVLSECEVQPSHSQYSSVE